jgi:SAM-dependent methyltransferase
MNPTYDKIARQYQRSKALPFRRYVEWYTYSKLLDDLSGKSVLDLACGEGFYSRRIKRIGAKRVVGVDISPAMIALARQQNTDAGLSIDYVVGDVLNKEKYGSFDLVVASYLLNYARTREQLLDMCRTIALNLKPGGRFVSINNNPDQPPDSFGTCKKYGFIKTISEPLQDGAAITYEFYKAGQKFRIENYYLSRNIHAMAFRRAGLKDPRWIKIEVDPEGIRRFGQEFWQDFLIFEPIIGIVSQK